MFKPVDEQLEILMQGVEEVVSAAELRKKLERSHRTGRPLRVKLGIDPTYTDIHIGHVVPLRKLAQFQQLGHQAVLIIGGFTARIGDPTGRKEARKQLTREQVQAYAANWRKQVGHVLDQEKTEFRDNSEWLEPLDFADVCELAANYTVARMLERQDFAERYAQGQPIHIHEFLYPLMQGQDSVAIRADIELGGMDQKFNLLVGRTLQERAGQEPQVCVLLPLLVGTDGAEKMSKSLGNHIGIDFPPQEMYGRTMSIPDSAMRTWYEIAATAPPAEVAAALRLHPRDAKMQLARRIVAIWHGEAAAQAAEEDFVRAFQKKELPENMPETVVPAGPLALVDLVARSTGSSRSEARRLVQQGAVEWNALRQDNPLSTVTPATGDVLRVGRRYTRIRIE